MLTFRALSLRSDEGLTLETSATPKEKRSTIMIHTFYCLVFSQGYFNTMNFRPFNPSHFSGRPHNEFVRFLSDACLKTPKEQFNLPIPSNDETLISPWVDKYKTKQAGHEI